MSKKGAEAAKMPTAAELKPILDLQSQYNRVGVETPFGQQNYKQNPDGSFNMVTTAAPEMQGLINRAGSLGMTDSSRMSVPPQLENMAGALASRASQRLGMNYGSQPMQLGTEAPRPAAKPQPTAQPQPGLPPMPPE